MPERPRIGLDNPAFQGRLRRPQARAQSTYVSRPIRRYADDISSAAPRRQASYAATQPAISRNPARQPAGTPRTTLPEEPASSRRRFSIHLPRLPHLDLPQRILIGVGCVVLMLGAWVSLSTLQTNVAVKQQVHALSSSDTSNGQSDDTAPPAETKPTNVATYHVAPNLPRMIRIPKIGVNARVKPISVNSKGELGVPSNIYDTAWYDASAHPGDSGSNGAILIDGHVHGPTLPGVFVNLKKLTVGDNIIVERGDGKTFTYVVVKTALVPAGQFNMAQALASAQPGEPGLNLVTCGGSYNKAGHYDSRTMVFAVLRS